MRSHRSKVRDLSPMLRPYMGKWVAMSSDQSHVIASAPTFKEILKKSQKQSKREKPIVLKVSDQYASFLLI